MSDLQAVCMLIAFVGIIGFVVAGIFWLIPSRRPRAKRLQIGSILAVVGGIVGFNIVADDKAAEITPVSEKTPTDKVEIVDMNVPGHRAPEKATAVPTKAEKEAAAKVEKRAACRADFQCWGRDRRIDAEVRCKRAIEGRAKYDHEWTDSWSAPMFSRFAWKDEKSGVMTYFGDRLRFQNGFGAWGSVTYSCDYDTERDMALSVSVIEGRL